MLRRAKDIFEKVGSQLVIHIKGTPEEMGTQQGKLLKPHILSMYKSFNKTITDNIGGSDVLLQLSIGSVWNIQKKYIKTNISVR